MHMTHEYATLVVKYGGNAMAWAASGVADPLLAEVATLWQAGDRRSTPRWRAVESPRLASPANG
jgi:hypothetical protein